MPDAPNQRLQVLQRGVESTAGTLVPATHRVNAEPGSIDVNNEITIIRRRYTGSAATSHSSSPGLVAAGLAYEEHATYDQLAVTLAATLAPTVTGTGAGADKTWVFTPSDSAPDALKRFSYEVGGRDTWPEEERFAGCVVSSLEITWNKQDDWMIATEWACVRSTQGAKAAGLTMPATLVPIIGKLTRCYIDPTTFGSTSYGRALSGVIRLENQISTRYGTDGNDYANRIVVLQRNITASLIVEYDATTLRTAWRAGTLQKLRVENVGPVLGSTAYNARFDIAGTWESSEIGEDDGIVTIAHDLTAEYNSSLGADVVGTVVCSIAAIP